MGQDIDGSNRAYVTDFTLGAVISVDLATGNRTTISDDGIGGGTNFIVPIGVTLDSVNNRLLVVEAANANEVIVAADIATGNRVAVANAGTRSGINLAYPEVIAFDHTNNLVYVTDIDLNAVFSINLANGNRTIFSYPTTGSAMNFGIASGNVLDLNKESDL